MLHAVAVSLLSSQLSPLQLMQLYQLSGSIDAIVENRLHIDELLPEATPTLKRIISGIDNLFAQAEEEIKFCHAHNIKILSIDDENYPHRLRNCDDAPLVLYYLGNGDINAQRIVNIIGTRKITPYGQDIIRRFVSDLHQLCPEALIVSGLAYGVDINAHREALAKGMSTVGVVAHGLDMVYPSLHRETARQMLAKGGILTEYTRGTRPEKRNFVQRNRIVAGMSDATILVESAERGGGLITCRISSDYGRDVFAFPGPINAPYSIGCNNLIRNNGAQLISSAQDFVESVGWTNDMILTKSKSLGIERQLFPDLSPDEAAVVETLKQGDLHVNQLAVKTTMTIGMLNSVLFTLEMKGVVRALAGGTYHLLT